MNEDLPLIPGIWKHKDGLYYTVPELPPVAMSEPEPVFARCMLADCIYPEHCAGGVVIPCVARAQYVNVFGEEPPYEDD